MLASSDWQYGHTPTDKTTDPQYKVHIRWYLFYVSIKNINQ